MERKLQQEIAGLRKELDKVLSPGRSSNSHKENTINRDTDAEYISLVKFKKCSKDLLKRYTEKTKINPAKFIYALAGMSSKRWSNITENSSPLKYISKIEAECLGNYLGIDGIKLFKDCKLVYNTVSVKSVKFPEDGWKIDPSLFENCNCSLLFQALGINYDLFELLENNKFVFYRKEIAKYIIDVIDVIQNLALSEDQKEKLLKHYKFEHKVQAKDTKSNLVLSDAAIAIVNRSRLQKAAEEVERRIDQEKRDKDMIITKLLSDLDAACSLLSQSEFKIVEDYIHGLTMSKSAKDMLLNHNTDSFLEVSLDDYPKVVSTKSFKEVLIKDHLKQEEDDLDVAVNLYKEGGSIKDCAEMLGMDSSKFREILISKGVGVIKGRKKSNTFDEKFQSVYWRIKGDTLTRKEGAKELGISYQALYQRMRVYEAMLKKEEVVNFV